jgi:hypothetical protein
VTTKLWRSIFNNICCTTRETLISMYWYFVLKKERRSVFVYCGV